MAAKIVRYIRGSLNFMHDLLKEILVGLFQAIPRILHCHSVSVFTPLESKLKQHNVGKAAVPDVITL